MVLVLSVCIFTCDMTAYAETAESGGIQPSDSVGEQVTDGREKDETPDKGTDKTDDPEAAGDKTEVLETTGSGDVAGSSGNDENQVVQNEEDAWNVLSGSDDGRVPDDTDDRDDGRVPDNPDDRDDGRVLGDPDNPDNPGDPDNSDNPDNPGDPDNPDDPDNPGDPDNPDDQDDPDAEGWHEEEDGSRYYIENGERLKDIRRKLDGEWWDFDQDGYAVRVEGIIAEVGESSFTPGDRVWFMNVAGGGYYSDMLLIESDGHWGLIDAGHRYADTIEDKDGTIYSVPYIGSDGSIAGCSCQIEGKNGRDIAVYMIRTLGVDHLDMIMTTHSHSDHCGGIPEIGEILVDDGGEELRSLIDANTIYLKKPYYHINSQQDDLGGETPREDGWHTQAFDYQAIHAVESRGGKVVNLNNGAVTGEGAQTKLDYSRIMEAMESNEAISRVTYDQRDMNDYFDDYLEFYFGNMQIRLYNLYTVSGNTLDDNPDSIAAVIKVKDKTLFTAGDLNVMYSVQQKISKVVRQDFGTIDYMKSCHHGAIYSSSVEMLDQLQPKVMITTGMVASTTNMSTAGVYFATVHYLRENYNTVIYEVGASDKAIALTFTGQGAELSELKGANDTAEMTSADNLINRVTKDEGWVKWVQVYDNNGRPAVYYYFKNGAAVTGWQDIDGDRYYFHENGLTHIGWYEENGKKYFFNVTADMKKGWLHSGNVYFYFDPVTGEMVTGRWVDYKNEKYYVGSDGIMCTGFNMVQGKGYFFATTGEMYKGWKDMSGGRYYFGEDGSMSVGWKLIGKDYYFFLDGCMKTGWINYRSGWYYCGSDGVMKAGAVKVDGKQYFFGTDGRLASKGWKKVGTNWYFVGADGVVNTGWERIGGKWYFLEKDGVMVTGWRKIDRVWYYFAPGGEMKTGWIRVKKLWYLLSESGALCTGWKQIGNTWYYLSPNGDMASGWKKIKGKWYFFSKSGAMACGWKKLKGKWYYFNENGAMVTGVVIIGDTKYRFRSDGAWVGNTN